MSCCKICGKKHKVWQCDILKNTSKQQTWETVKTPELCFCCFEGHKVAKCSWGSTFDIDGYLKKNNRMSHSANQEDKLEQNPACQSQISLMEREEQQSTPFMVTECQRLGCISLPTRPTIVKNGSKGLTVNALLYGGSTQTNLNADIAATLNLHKENLKNGIHIKEYVNTIIEAFTTNDVTVV